MDLFNNIFGNPDASDPQHAINWNPLVSVKQLEEISAISFDQPVVIFKHSTRCGISRMALKNFENEYDLNTKVTAYYLDLLAHHDVSDAVSEKFNVYHQSPQLLLIKDGKAIYDASHSAIEAEKLNAFL